MSIGNLTYDQCTLATPSDTTNEPTGPFSAFYIWGTAGTVSFVDASGNSISASASLPAGTLIRIKGVRINATGTSAGAILLARVPA